MMEQVVKIIEKGKYGGWRPNSGRKSGFVGYWKGKKRPGLMGCGNWGKPKYGDENIFSKINFGGDKHPNWKGGTWLYWKKQTMLRDNYTCQMCNLYDPEVVVVDHIIPNKVTGKKYIDKEHDINNLQTLCANCHLKKSRLERKEGAKNKSYYSL